MHAANVAATRAVGWLAQRSDLDPTRVSGPASASVADVVVVHLLAASVAIERLPASASITPAFLTDPELATVDDESLGGRRGGGRRVGLDGLDRLTMMAASSDEGMVHLRAGLNGFQQRRADGTASLMLATDDPAVAQRGLDQALGESGHIEGYFIGTIGGALEGAARAADARTSFFITVGGAVVGMIACNVPLVPFFASGAPVYRTGCGPSSPDPVTRWPPISTPRRPRRQCRAVPLHGGARRCRSGNAPRRPAGRPPAALGSPAGDAAEPRGRTVERGVRPGAGAVVLDLDAVADAVTLEQQDAYVRLPYDAHATNRSTRAGQKMPAGSRPSISVRPISHSSRVSSGAASASGGRPAVPIGVRAFHVIV